jgi:hypothetical protein
MDQNVQQQKSNQGHHAIDINSLLNPSVEESPIPHTDHVKVSANSSASLEATTREPTFSEQVVQNILPDEIRKAGSNSPMSAESTNSNGTDSANQFYQAHHGYQAQEVEIPLLGQQEEQQQDTTMAEAPSSPQQDDSEAQSVAPDDVVLPDDGYYPTSLHVDSEMSDTDSAIGSEIMSSTMSLRSSLYESIQENGRSYHKYKEGQYYLPNDDLEQDRLNLQHHLWTLTLDGRLHLAPTENPQHVLDIGTGTGLWALEYAERNPSSMVIGTGNSPAPSITNTPY